MQAELASGATFMDRVALVRVSEKTEYLSVNWSQVVACHAYLLCIETSKQD